MLGRLSVFLLIVLMQEQAQAVVVHLIRLRERERPAHKPRQPLTQNVVEALNMTRLPCTFASWPMLSLRQNFGVGRPKVGIE